MVLHYLFSVVVVLDVLVKPLLLVLCGELLVLCSVILGCHIVSYFGQKRAKYDCHILAKG